jgi:transcription termination factor NusB
MATKLNAVLLQEAVGLAKNKLSTDRSQLVNDILTRVVINSLRKYQQKVNVGIVDSLSDIINNLKANLIEEVLLSSQGWMVGQNRKQILFPKNCRFLYTRGRSVIAVIEEGAGTRTLRLDNNLLNTERTPSHAQQSQPHSLALPYSVFVIHFDNDLRNDKVDFKNMYLYWNKRPLATLDDQLYQPILPNIHAQQAVCIGNRLTLDDNATLSQQCEQVIGHFWNSTFNPDLGDRWWGRGSIDARLRDVEQWKSLSRDDPLFALSLNLRPAVKLKEIINTISASHVEVSLDMEAMKKRLVEIVDKASSDIEHGLMNYMKKTKFERFFPNDIRENLSAAISTIADEIIVILNRMSYDLDQIERQSNRNQKDVNHYGWEGRGVFWS